MRSTHSRPLASNFCSTTSPCINGNKCAKVIACVNHDANAILSHQANHPDTLHFTEDIRTLELSPLISHLNKMKSLYPDALVVLWASLECTNFSKAKGGQPRDADSRTLAEHLLRYIESIKPNYIQIENVEEFMSWGKLDENGHPLSRFNGTDYVRWVKQVKAYGYEFDYRLLNAADFGAYTSRKRFFGLFAQIGLPIAFPIPTYAKDGDSGMFLTYKKWKAVRDVLDLQEEGVSIFQRKKPLCEKTLQRIYAGLVKFVAGGKEKHDAWILKYNSMNQSAQHNAPSIDEPCPTVAVQNRLGLVKLNFLSKQFSGEPMSKNQSIEQPAGTVTCVDHHALVSAKFISEYYGGNEHNHSLNVPASTITTKDRHAFVTAYFGNGYNSSIDEPNPTITTKERHALVSIDMDAPMPDVPLDKLKLIGKRFLLSQHPKAELSASKTTVPESSTFGQKTPIHPQQSQYLLNPYSFQSDGGSIEKPCFTLIARMDKMPPYLVSTEQGDLAIEIYEHDSPMTRQIKEFMAMYGIIDIKMRMLTVIELKRIMGFPPDYILIGTQAEQKKFIGNAVEVGMAQKLCEALCTKLLNEKWL